MQKIKSFFIRSLVIVLALGGLGAGWLYVSERDQSAAYQAAQRALARHLTPEQRKKVRYLAVVDFTKPSFMRRMAIYDLRTGKVSYYQVTHGNKSGGLFATRFSNRMGSHMSSLGLYRIGPVYHGKFGLSLRLHGLEPGLNDQAFRRAIVLHPAWYVGYDIVWRNLLMGYGPRIGRSQGCFAVEKSKIREIVNKLRHNAYLYAWHG